MRSSDRLERGDTEMKAVLLSGKPKWCKLIASGIKTIEVRKTKPKIETPFKCYIYCTMDKHDRFICRGGDDMPFDVGNGTVIGEFVCDWINEYSAEFVDDDCYEEIRQIFEDDGEEDYCTITSNEDDNPNNCTLCIKSCLSFNDIKKYIGINFHEKRFYGWHISNLKIYDKPKELSEFKGRKLVWRGNNHIHEYEKLTRPFQSWGYVYETDT